MARLVRRDASCKVQPMFFNFVVFCNPCLSSPSLTILVPFLFIVSYLSKLSSFLGNFVRGQNNF